MGRAKDKSRKKQSEKVQKTNDGCETPKNPSVSPPIVVPTQKVKEQKDHSPVDLYSLDSRAAKDRTNTEYESDKGYRIITEQIINISGRYLKSQQDSKNQLRNKFVGFFSKLLKAQYIVLVIIVFLNSLEHFSFSVSENILRVYIISVFAETLSAMAVMIAFAFASKEETKIVEVLNNIVENFQKVNLNGENKMIKTLIKILENYQNVNMYNNKNCKKR